MSQQRINVNDKFRVVSKGTILTILWINPDYSVTKYGISIEKPDGTHKKGVMTSYSLRWGIKKKDLIKIYPIDNSLDERLFQI